MIDKNNIADGASPGDESAAAVRAAIVSVSGLITKCVDGQGGGRSIEFSADASLKLANSLLVLTQAEQNLAAADKARAETSIVDGLRAQIIQEVIEPLAKATRDSLQDLP